MINGFFFHRENEIKTSEFIIKRIIFEKQDLKPLVWHPEEAFD